MKIRMRLRMRMRMRMRMKMWMRLRLKMGMRMISQSPRHHRSAVTSDRHPTEAAGPTLIPPGLDTSKTLQASIHILITIFRHCCCGISALYCFPVEKSVD